MTRIVLTDGRHYDVAIPAHTVIALRIEHHRKGLPFLFLAGHTIPVADIAAVVPEFCLPRSEAA